jgi:hypothetical protein
MNKEPSYEEWLKLFETALKFKQIEPWNWMDDGSMFGIKDPETGNIGYCCVIGLLGEVFGLIVYRGEDGLKSWLKIQQSGNPDDLDNFYIQDCLSVTFEDRAYLRKEDLQLIKKLGLKFRGRNAYPQFKSLMPGYFPWFITKEECSFLIKILGQAYHVCLQVKDNDKYLIPPAKGHYLIRHFDGVSWKEIWQKLELPKQEDAVSIRTNEIRLAAIKKNSVKSSGKWEMDMFYSTIPIKDKGDERPYFPKATIIVDHISGHIFNLILSKPEGCHQSIHDGFIEFIEKVAVIPQEIFLERDELKSIIQPAADALGIKLTKAKKCKMARQVREGMIEFERMSGK